MNLGIIAKTNSKGQIVIPKRYRDELGIDEDVLLNISVQGKGVYITTVEDTFSDDSKKLYLDTLKKTAGSWVKDSWQKTEKKRRKLELSASAIRKKEW